MSVKGFKRNGRCSSPTLHLDSQTWECLLYRLSFRPCCLSLPASYWCQVYLYHIHSCQLKGLDSLFIRTMQGTTVTTAVNLTGVALWPTWAPPGPASCLAPASRTASEGAAVGLRQSAGTATRSGPAQREEPPVVVDLAGQVDPADQAAQADQAARPLEEARTASTPAPAGAAARWSGRGPSDQDRPRAAASLRASAAPAVALRENVKIATERSIVNCDWMIKLRIR